MHLDKVFSHLKEGYYKEYTVNYNLVFGPLRIKGTHVFQEVVQKLITKVLWDKNNSEKFTIETVSQYCESFIN